MMRFLLVNNILVAYKPKKKFPIKIHFITNPKILTGKNILKRPEQNKGTRPPSTELQLKYIILCIKTRWAGDL